MDGYRKRSETILRMSYLRRTEHDDGAESADDSDMRQDRAQFLLRMDNGDWSEKKFVTHYCRLGCGCQNEQEALCKTVLAIAQVVMSSRPKVPALSRWTTCLNAARFFMRGA